MLKNFKPISLILLAGATCFPASIFAETMPSKQSMNISQQSGKVTGTVEDDLGPVAGASVVVKGTTNGNITDMDGNFTLEGVKNGDIIQISFIGYTTQEIPYTGQSSLQIKLAEDTQKLEEVVVVGYGVQKKVNLTGAVGIADSEILEDRPIGNIAQGLQGAIPNLNIDFASGNPNAATTFNVRGATSLNGGQALLLVDGVETSDLSLLNPQDIESVSVLKDAASASIYGARAAFGVVLITTKKGKKEQKVQINYNNNFSWSMASRLPDGVSSDKWIRAMNQANVNNGSGQYFKDEHVQAVDDFIAGRGPSAFYTTDNSITAAGQWAYAGNTDWFDVMYKPSFMQQHNASISGGSDKTTYYGSIGYKGQDGILQYGTDKYKRINMSFNFSTQITKWLEVTFRTKYNRNTSDYPYTSNFNLGNIFYEIYRGFPTIPVYLPNGNNFAGIAGSNFNYNFAGLLDGAGRDKTNSDDFWYTAAFNLTPLAGLSIKGDYTGNKFYQDQTQHGKILYQTMPEESTLSPLSVGTPGGVTKANYGDTYQALNLWADYKKSFNDKHNLGVMVGYNQESKKTTKLSVSTSNLFDNNFPVTDLASTYNMPSEEATIWAVQGAFFRLNYDYMQKYLLEVNGRYDGSSKYMSGDRWGFFPSVSAGWRISEEQFWKENENLSFINNLKLKASYGILGNNNIGNYPYQSVYSLGQAQNYVFGGVYTQGAAVTTYVDPGLKWERTRTTDVGIETAFFNNKLTFNASYFYRKTTDVLYKPAASYSSIFGLSVSQVNTGELENKGWEFEIGHQNTIGKFHYHINGNFSIIDNKVLTLGMGNVTQNNGMVGNGSDLFIGYPMQMFYGYKTDGVFLTDDEVGDWYDQTAIAKGSKAGDIRYVDITGDGKVTPDDKTFLGSRIPKYTFGLNFGGEYKGFDFSVLLQGVAKVKGMLSVYAGHAFYQEGNIQKWQMENCWNVQQDNRYPEYPRLEIMSNAGSNNTLTSDFWVLDASFLKVRNVQLGYTLPEHIVKKFGSTGMRFYVSLDNPLTFKGYRKGWDPENTSNNGQYYPTMSTYTLGLTLKF